VRTGFGQDGFGLGIGPEVEADGLEGAGGGGAHEPVVPDPREAFRKNVDEPTADELFSVMRRGSISAC
jgi:hypothetical protein